MVADDENGKQSAREEKYLRIRIKELMRKQEDPEKKKEILFKEMDDSGFRLWERASDEYKEDVWMAALKKANYRPQKKQELSTAPENPPAVPLSEIPQFRDPQLLRLINDELSKRHVYDDFEKLTVFLVACTSKAKNPRHRMSAAAIGDSAVGKDNLLDTVSDHFPRVLKVTRATESTLEDDIQDADIIRFSELNANREDGANKSIVETFKQLAEGGVSALKKDAQSGFKQTRHSVQEQKTLLFGTTEERRDEELETRFITISVRKDSRKIRSVNENTLKNWSTPEGLIALNCTEDSWIKNGIAQLQKHHVIIPYANRLLSIFDSEEPRSQRDIKRLMALTAAHAWLYQLQRPIIERQGQRFIIAMPVDFINVYKVSGSFFNMTYKGLEDRLQHILDVIKEMTGDDYGKTVRRADLEKALGIAKNTLKERLRILRDMNFLEAKQEGNDWYYTRCQTGCQRLLIGVNLEELRTILQNNIDTLYNPLDTHIDTLRMAEEAEIDVSGFFSSQGVKGVKIHTDTPLTPSERVDDSVSVTFDTFNLTPYQKHSVTPSDGAILQAINGMPQPVLVDEVAALFPGCDVAPRLIALKERGDIYEPRPGYVEVLR